MKTFAALFVLAGAVAASSSKTNSTVAASTSSSAAACESQYSSCQVQPESNHATCAAQYAACLGYNPFTTTSSSSVASSTASVLKTSSWVPTTMVSSKVSASACKNKTSVATAPAVATTTKPDVYVTEVLTSFTTYCPDATTAVFGGKTYTVSSATTLTITQCPGGCKVTKPVAEIPANKTVTAVVSSFTTYCPSATTATFGNKTYTVTSATTLTVTSCHGGCTITAPVSVITPFLPASSHASASTHASGSAPVSSHAAGTAPAPASSHASKSAHASDSTSASESARASKSAHASESASASASTSATESAHASKSAKSSESAHASTTAGASSAHITASASKNVTGPASTTSAFVATYTGAANQLLAGGSFLAVGVAGAFFL